MQTLIVQDKDALTEVAGSALLGLLAELSSTQDAVHLALTGGGVGIGLLAAAAQRLDDYQIEWSKVHCWWGDERWLAHDDTERNERQAREALLHLLPEAQLHPFAAADQGITLEQASERAVAELNIAGLDHQKSFDLVLLGVGPDGHVASLFPGQPWNTKDNSPVLVVCNSPKPPSERLSLSLDFINAAERVWLVAAGAEKQEALSGVADRSKSELPASAVAAREETILMMDAAAAGQSPHTSL